MTKPKCISHTNMPQTICHLCEDELNEEKYFQSLLTKASDKNLLNVDHRIRIQGTLQALLAEQVTQYTSGDSSSVRIEVAENLLQSIYYCLSEYFKTIENIDEKIKLLQECNLKDLFIKGKETIKSYVIQSKQLFSEVQSSSLKINNYAYNDTIFHGLGVFFDYYDIKFGAHNTPCDIDYPLSKDIMHLTGIVYMHRYLSYLNIENQFCSHFSDSTIEQLLRGYSKYYQEDLINIYELVLGNALGRVIIGNDLTDLDITDQDRDELAHLLGECNQNELKDRLLNAFDQINSSMGFGTIDSSYLKEAILPFTVRLQHNLKLGNLNKIFISLKATVNGVGEFYESGIRMDDEKLRTLIDEMRECRYVSDKIVMLKRNVTSLDDLGEILKECFWGEEKKEVIKLLSSQELIYLQNLLPDVQIWRL